jgi:hypothetical protein
MRSSNRFRENYDRLKEHLSAAWLERSLTTSSSSSSFSSLREVVEMACYCYAISLGCELSGVQTSECDIARSICDRRRSAQQMKYCVQSSESNETGRDRSKSSEAGRARACFDVVLKQADTKGHKFLVFALFGDETYGAAAENGVFDAKEAFETRGTHANGREDAMILNDVPSLPESDVRVHEKFSDALFFPIYQAFSEAVASIPGRVGAASLRALPKEILEKVYRNENSDGGENSSLRGIDLIALTCTSKQFKAHIDEKEDELFLNAIDKEFPGFIREIDPMEVDAGRVVAGTVRGSGTKTRKDFTNNGGTIVPKQEYKRLIQERREREENRIREESTVRMRDNMSSSGRARGGGMHIGGGGAYYPPARSSHDIVPGFPGFVPGITGGAYDLYPNPNPTGGFNPLPDPSTIPGIGGGRGRGQQQQQQQHLFEFARAQQHQHRHAFTGGIPTPNPDRNNNKFGPSNPYL